MDTFRRSARPQLMLHWTAQRQLTRQLGGAVAHWVTVQARLAYPALAVRIPETGPGARNLLRTGVYAVALRRALLDVRIEPARATALVSDVVFASIRPARNALRRLARLRHRDALRRLLWVSDIARRFYYTRPDWEMEDVAVEDGFGMDITRCVVAEFFASLGMSELCEEVICVQDARVAAHHGIRFERSGTLAGGADRCDFRYRLLPPGSAHG